MQRNDEYYMVLYYLVNCPSQQAKHSGQGVIRLPLGYQEVANSKPCLATKFKSKYTSILQVEISATAQNFEG